MSFSVHSPSSYSALGHSGGGRCGSGGTNDANPGGCMTPAVEDRQGGEVGSRPPGLALVKLKITRCEMFLCIPMTPGEQVGGTHVPLNSKEQIWRKCTAR